MASLPLPPAPWRRLAAEAGLLLVVGLFMAITGPYGSDALGPGRRLAYWTLGIVGGGVIGIAIDTALERRRVRLWPRVALASLLMTPAVAAWVLGLIKAFGQRSDAPNPLFVWQVFVICLAVMTARALVWRRPAGGAREAAAAPLPSGAALSDPTPSGAALPDPTPSEAGAAFRRRLSARRRGARLFAVEAHDHYLRVHTDAGAELVALRFADALEELAGVPGFRTHRSWWVAADAVQAVRWRKGAGEAQLPGELRAPVSRTQAAALKDAGWS